MRRLNGSAVLTLGCAFVWMGTANAQGRGAADWTTAGGDAQRSSWVRTDPKISKESMQKPGFQFLWKVKLGSDPKQSNALTPAVMLSSYIGYRGFRSLAFASDGSDNVYAIDTDLGRLEWHKHLGSGPVAAASSGCPGGMTANLTRPTGSAFPGAGPAGRGGRGGAAKGGVGDAGQGAVTIAEVNAAAARGGRAGAPAVPPPPDAPGGRGPGRGAPPAAANIFARGASYVYALSSDGMLHWMYVSNGEEPVPPAPFLPAGANARGLVVIDNVAYVATTQGCGGAANGLWALDLTTKEVASWKSNSGGVSGSVGPSVGPDGTFYVATDGGELVALEPKTLKMKEAYSGNPGFVSTPVVFDYKDKNLIAAATKDGQIHLLDTAALAKPLFKTPVSSSAPTGALSTWQDSAGTRWILAPSTNAITAWKVVDQNGTPSLQSGWVSREMISPLPPMIINGVVFAAAGGQRSTPAVLYALDADTGKELWSSGKTMTSFVHGGGLAGGSSQMYLGTSDGTFYAFGFWIEH